MQVLSVRCCCWEEKEKAEDPNSARRKSFFGETTVLSLNLRLLRTRRSITVRRLVGAASFWTW